MHYAAKMSKIDRLHLWMHLINVFSVFFLLAMTGLKYLGLDVDDSFLSRKYEYIHSIEPFIPESLLSLIGTFVGDSLPVQTVKLGSFTLYFPGVAVECILGTLQGILLGMDLLRTPRQGNYQTPALPATALFLYAGMCITAFPIHCLKDIAMFDIRSGSVIATSLQWVDTWCTSCVPPIALLALLVENGLAEPSYERFVPWILLFSAVLTWFGAFLPNRWITFTLHALSQFIFIVPFVYLTTKRSKQLDCTHGLAISKFGKYRTILGVYCVAASIAILSIMTEGSFCPLASVFLVSRIAIVQYWSYSRSQTDCKCANKCKDD